MSSGEPVHSHRGRTSILTLALITCVASRSSAQGSPPAADIVLLGGKVITVNARDDVAQAVAIQCQLTIFNGKVVFERTRPERASTRAPD